MSAARHAAGAVRRKIARGLARVIVAAVVLAVLPLWAAPGSSGGPYLSESRFLATLGTTGSRTSAPPIVVPSGCEGRCLTLAGIAGGSEAAGDSSLGGDYTTVIVTLRGVPPLRAKPGASRAERLERTVRALQEHAGKRAAALRIWLLDRQRQGRVARVVPLWIINGFSVTATPETIAELAAHPDVREIHPELVLAAPEPALAATDAGTYLDLVGAEAMWALGHRGQGVVVAGLDTGVDADHPDLAPTWRGGNNSWYDPYGERPVTPADPHGHGTHTMGVMVGRDAGGVPIGMAPDAEWIATRAFDDAGVARETELHLAFQWLHDPDGDPATPDAPHVVNASWGASTPGCALVASLRADVQALRAAGILTVFAAGNTGPGPSSDISPANWPESIAVGATDGIDALWEQSARGPTDCGGLDRVYPHLVAPGVRVRTSTPGGGYAAATGTSLAAPHVTGALALLLSAWPDLSTNEGLDALLAAAQDLGDLGPDDAFGHGQLDVLAAHRLLQSEGDLHVAVTDGAIEAVPGTRIIYTITVGWHGAVPVEGARISGPLPAELVDAAWQCTATGGVCALAGGGGDPLIDVTLADGGTAVVHVTATIAPSATGELRYTVAAAVPPDAVDGEAANDVAVDVTRLRPSADVALVDVDWPSTTRVGRPVTGTITIANHGPSTAGSTTLTQTTPPGAAAPSLSGCSATDEGMVCSLPEVGPGATITTALTITPTAVGAFPLTTTLSCRDDPSPGDGVDNVLLRVDPWRVTLPFVAR